MAAVGTSSTVHISLTDSSYLSLGRVITANLDMSVDMLEATSNDDAGVKTFLPGDKMAKLNVTLRYDSTDAQQASLLDAAINKTAYFFRFRPTVGAGLPEWRFQGYLETAPVQSQHNQIVESTFTVQSTGALTKAAQ